MNVISLDDFKRHCANTEALKVFLESLPFTVEGEQFWCESVNGVRTQIVQNCWAVGVEHRVSYIATFVVDNRKAVEEAVRKADGIHSIAHLVTILGDVKRFHLRAIWWVSIPEKLHVQYSDH